MRRPRQRAARHPLSTSADSPPLPAARAATNRESRRAAPCRSADTWRARENWPLRGGPEGRGGRRSLAPRGVGVCPLLCPCGGRGFSPHTVQRRAACSAGACARACVGHDVLPCCTRAELFERHRYGVGHCHHPHLIAASRDSLRYRRALSGLLVLPLFVISLVNLFVAGPPRRSFSTPA